MKSNLDQYELTPGGPRGLDLADHVRSWVGQAVESYDVPAGEQVHYAVGMFVGTDPDGIFYGLLGIYLDVQGTEEQPLERPSGVPAVNPKAATQEFVTSLVHDALHRLYRDREKLAEAQKQRLPQSEDDEGAGS